MPIKSNTEDWIVEVRTFIRDTIGSSWQITKNKNNVMLGIRFAERSRSFTYLPYKWQRSNQEKIRGNR